MTTHPSFEKLLHDVESPIISLTMLQSLLETHPSDDYSSLGFLITSLDNLSERLDKAKKIIIEITSFDHLTSDEKTKIASFSNDLNLVDSELKRIRKSFA